MTLYDNVYGLLILQFDLNVTDNQLHSIPQDISHYYIAKVQWVYSLGLLGAVDCLYWRYDQQQWILFYV